MEVDKLCISLPGKAKQMALIEETIPEKKIRAERKNKPIISLTPEIEAISALVDPELLAKIESTPPTSTVLPTIKPKRNSKDSKKVELAFPKLAFDNEKITKILKRRLPILIILVALFSSGLTYAISKQFDQGVVDQTSFLAKTSGGVALTEIELINVVEQLKSTVYWVGPLKDARYTINATTPGQIYVRYLPNGNGVNDLSAKYRVIATYSEPNAYESTAAAGNEANGVSFFTPEGSVVHYNKSVQNNVYVAYKDIAYQIEIFDPLNSEALNLATAPNQVQLIKSN